MKKLIAIAVLTIFSLIISACSSGSVVGKWERTDNKNVLEFTPDGKLVLYGASGERSGSSADWTYKSDTAGKLEVNDNNLNPKCIYKIEGSKMTMNCSQSKGGDFPKDFQDENGAQMILTKK